MEWQSPYDTPEYYKNVLIYYKKANWSGKEIHDYGIGYCYRFNEWYSLNDGIVICLAWMPLPEPPEFVKEM